mmetsp:Transcript_109022/g.222617  ORF Transcript_109022/g.222617 Transcript_109022/m.222617 type:complete len:259 (-) Transcript_109022:702-1478(-)
MSSSSSCPPPVLPPPRPSREKKRSTARVILFCVRMWLESSRTMLRCTRVIGESCSSQGSGLLGSLPVRQLLLRGDPASPVISVRRLVSRSVSRQVWISSCRRRRVMSLAQRTQDAAEERSALLPPPAAAVPGAVLAATATFSFSLAPGQGAGPVLPFSAPKPFSQSERICATLEVCTPAPTAAVTAGACCCSCRRATSPSVTVSANSSPPRPGCGASSQEPRREGTAEGAAEATRETGPLEAPLDVTVRVSMEPPRPK